jgi:hypothetical protein
MISILSSLVKTSSSMVMPTKIYENKCDTMTEKVIPKVTTPKIDYSKDDLVAPNFTWLSGFSG